MHDGTHPVRSSLAPLWDTRGQWVGYEGSVGWLPERPAGEVPSVSPLALSYYTTGIRARVIIMNYPTRRTRTVGLGLRAYRR